MGMTLPLSSWLAQLPRLSAGAAPDVLLDILQATTSNLGWLLVVLVTTYYLLLDWPRLREWLLGLVPAERRSSVLRLYGEIATVWRLYLHGQLRLMFFVGLLTGLLLAAVGLPGAWAFGFLAGLLDVILTAGPTLVTALAAIVAYFTGSTILPISNLWFALIVIGLNALIQGLENVWLRPRIMGATLKLHPAIVFIAIIGSLALAGVLTALIIIPLLGSLAIIGRYVYCRMLGIDPWTVRLVREAPASGEDEAA
jgi:predicted PurR-regulated permease PerM